MKPCDAVTIITMIFDSCRSFCLEKNKCSSELYMRKKKKTSFLFYFFVSSKKRPWTHKREYSTSEESVFVWIQCLIFLFSVVELLIAIKPVIVLGSTPSAIRLNLIYWPQCDGRRRKRKTKKEERDAYVDPASYLESIDCIFHMRSHEVVSE